MNFQPTLNKEDILNLYVRKKRRAFSLLTTIASTTTATYSLTNKCLHVNLIEFEVIRFSQNIYKQIVLETLPRRK